MRHDAVGGLVFNQQFAFPFKRFKANLATVDCCGGGALAPTTRQVITKTTADTFFGAAVIDQVSAHIEHINPGFVGGISDIRLKKGDLVSINRHLLLLRLSCST